MRMVTVVKVSNDNTFTVSGLLCLIRKIPIQHILQAAYSARMGKKKISAMLKYMPYYGRDDEVLRFQWRIKAGCLGRHLIKNIGNMGFLTNKCSSFYSSTA